MRNDSRSGNPRRVLDTRIAILLVFSYALWLFLSVDLRPTAGLVTGFLLFALILVRERTELLRRLILGLPSVLLMIVLIWLLVPIPGREWFQFWGREFTRESLVRGATLGIRFLGLYLGSLLLYAVSNPGSLARAITWYLSPVRLAGISLRPLEYVLWVAFRTIPVLTTEAVAIKYAQRARGATMGGGITNRMRSIVSTIIPVFAAAIRRSDQFALALRARGFDPYRMTPHRNHGVFRLPDGIVFLLVLIGWTLVFVSPF